MRNRTEAPTMRTQIRILGTAMATAVFSLSLVAAPAFAATAPATPTATLDRPDNDRHARFCAKMDHLLKRLVEKGAITREQAARILEALGCKPDANTAPSN